MFREGQGRRLIQGALLGPGGPGERRSDSMLLGPWHHLEVLLNGTDADFPRSPHTQWRNMSWRKSTVRHQTAPLSNHMLPSFLGAEGTAAPPSVINQLMRSHRKWYPPGYQRLLCSPPRPRRMLSYPLAWVSNWAWVALDTRGTRKSLKNTRRGGQMWAVRWKRGMWLGVVSAEEIWGSGKL